MENSIRTFDSEIIIDSSSRWFFRGNEITLDTVLGYFRENLFEDDKGIYIFNSYGKLTEKGYLTCIGYPLRIVDLESGDDTLYFLGDNKIKIRLEDSQIFVDSDNRLVLRKKNEKFINYVFSRDVHTKLGDFMEENNGTFYIKYNKISSTIGDFPGSSP